MQLEPNEIQIINDAIDSLVLTDEEKNGFAKLMADENYQSLIKILDSYLENAQTRQKQFSKLREQVTEKDVTTTWKADPEELTLLEDISKAERVKQKLTNIAYELEDNLFDEAIENESKKVKEKFAALLEQSGKEVEASQIAQLRKKLK